MTDWACATKHINVIRKSVKKEQDTYIQEESDQTWCYALNKQVMERADNLTNSSKPNLGNQRHRALN
jgi:hypothetical protein